MITVRNLREKESMPEGMATGYESMPLMPAWVWVVELDGKPQGVVMAAPCHGMVYMMRLCFKEGSDKAMIPRLLRACMKDCRDRGFRGFFFHADPTKEMDRKLIPLVKRTGGVQLTVPQVLLAGSIERAAKF